MDVTITALAILGFSEYNTSAVVSRFGPSYSVPEPPHGFLLL